MSTKRKSKPETAPEDGTDVEAVAEQATPLEVAEVVAPARVHLGNLGWATLHVPLVSTILALGPKQTAQVDADQVNDATRQLVAAGTLVLHTL